MRTDELDFELPRELIAQTPCAERAGARLMHYRRKEREIKHRWVAELPKLLRGGDVLVFNDTRVIPARFTLVKSTGGKVEGLFLRETEPGRWSVLLRDLGGARERLRLAGADIEVRVMGAGQAGEYEIELRPARAGEFADNGFENPGETPHIHAGLQTAATPVRAEELLERVGRMPLPPYIKRLREGDERDGLDRQRYQTVYAANNGSVAAPTAGLHFTPEVLAELDAAGVERVMVTLHVGLGTFKPVNSATLEGHAMHAERYEVSVAAATALNAAKREGRRIVAVGTTAARVLESQAAGESFSACRGSTEIFIYPPYAWKHVGALVTNFHLPRSTLIALVAAMMGLEEQRRAYATAIAQGYRFFSYGDAMLIE